MTDPYRVLGISRDASTDEVKKAYRALSRKYHPDMNINNPNKEKAEEMFKLVQQAYKQIMDEREHGADYSGYGYGGTGGYGTGGYGYGGAGGYGTDSGTGQYNGGYGYGQGYGQQGQNTDWSGWYEQMGRGYGYGGSGDGSCGNGGCGEGGGLGRSLLGCCALNMLCNCCGAPCSFCCC